MGRLTAALVDKAKAGKAAPGRYRDGPGGLMLVVGERSASWVLRYRLRNKRRDMGLGSVQVLGLARAREIAQARRFEVKVERVDPVATKRAEAQAAARSITFDKAVEAFLATKAMGFRDPRGLATWQASLATYASPVIGKLAVSAITTQHLLDILAPVWATKTETATRVRGRVEAVLDWCKTQGYRDGENPSRWRGHLSTLLPSKSKVKGRTKHHAAVPVAAIPATYKALAAQSSSLDAMALRLTILTAARVSEVLDARWAEFDLATATWTVAAERMKAGREHRVPLSNQAVGLLRDLQRTLPSAGRLFPEAITPQALLRALRAASGVPAATTHGCRSCLDDWAHERGFDSRLVDYSLAHYPSGTTIAPYRRADLLEQRRPLLQAWADFLRG
jgi:integrase